tara:strand:+ start:1859 stop:2518 length:660 start_codon:yes stop_codon:yes gene_type:complete
MILEKKIVIFDFDGVILDTDLLKYNIFKNIFNIEKKSIQKKILKYHFLNQGINRIKKFEYIVTNITKKKNIIEEVKYLESLFSKKLKKDLNKCKFSTGAIQGMEALKENKIKMFLATGVNKKEIDKIIIKFKLKKYFEKVYGYPLKKDKIIKIIKKQENVKYSNIYFIGDSLSDLKAAKKTNINFLGRKTVLNSKLLGKNKFFKEKNVYKITKTILSLY